MYMNDAFHATNQIPQRAVTEGLICLYCPLDPTDGGSSERYSFSTKYVATTDTGQLNANAYLIGYQLQLFNNFDGFVTFPPPIGDQFVQQDRRKIYGGNVSYMMPGNVLGFDAKNTIGFQTRTDDIHIDLAETTGRVVRFTVRDDHVIESSAGAYVENRVQWADKFRTMTGLREDLYYGSDESTLRANSGKIVQAITSPKGNLIFGPWNDTEYYLSVGQGFHSNDLRGAFTNVDALATEINFVNGNPTVVTQGKTPLLTKATGYEVGARSQPLPNLKLEGALFVLNLASEATFDGDEAVTTPGRPSQRKGIELTASYKPLDWLQLDGDFAETHARLRQWRYRRRRHRARPPRQLHSRRSQRDCHRKRDRRGSRPVVRSATLSLFWPPAADRGRQRHLETDNACRPPDRLQIFRPGEALARHPQFV
jgi:hypothetical protein